MWNDIRDLFGDTWVYVKLVAPASIGAIIGIRWAVDQTPRARAVSFLCSCFLGAWAGAWISEIYGLTYSASSVVTVVCCSVSMEVMAGINAVARSFSGNPFGFVVQVFDLWGRLKNGGKQP